MATYEERKHALEAMELEQIREQFGWLGAGPKKENWSKERVIEQLLYDLEKERGESEWNKFDNLLHLETNREQDRRLKQTATDSAGRSAAASEDSAKSARAAARAKWIPIGISVGALLVAIIAL